MMEMLPYGANILVKSKSTTLGNKFPLQQPDFISGSSGPVTITYDYEEENGILIGIDTNLRYELDTDNKTFLLSNDNIFDNKDEKPYIKLLCDDVYIPISFIERPGTGGNKWSSENTAYSDKIRLNGSSNGNYVDIAKGYKISWSKQESQKIFLGKDTSGGDAYGEYYACEAFYQYLDDNGQIQNGNSEIWSVEGRAPFNTSVTIPKLNGELSTLITKEGNSSTSKKFINYFVLGVQVKVYDGYNTYQPTTRFYIEGNNRIYNNTSTIKEISIPPNEKRYLKSDKVPNHSYSDVEYKWNTDFFYKLETRDSSNNDILISPSTSQIKYNWLFDCTEHNSCPNDGGCPNDGSCPEHSAPSDWPKTGIVNNNEQYLRDSPGGSIIVWGGMGGSSFTASEQSGSWYYITLTNGYHVGKSGWMEEGGLDFD